MTDDTDTLLESWGAWSSRPDLRLGYRRALAQQGSTPNITDNDAMGVDQAMCRLKRSRPETYAVLFAYYVRNLSVRQIAKHGGSTEGSVYRLLKTGVAWIDGALTAVEFEA